MDVIDFNKEKMKSLTKEQQESYENARISYICKEKFESKYLKDKKYCKVRDHSDYTMEYRGAVHSICNLEYIIPKIIPITFHNESNYDYYFIIKEFIYLFISFNLVVSGENSEKSITFTVPIKKRSYKN